MAISELLDIKNLKTHFISKDETVRAVDGIELTVNKGETVAIVGESGSGKSMTALSVLQLVPTPGGKIVDGEVNFNNQDLLELTEREMQKIRGNEISMIFQEPMTSLNPVLTIGRQMTEVLRYHMKMEKNEATERAIELLKAVGFSRAEELIDDYPHRLSGGMRQRVMIAMAMSCNPKLLIADEPTTALDVTIQAQILEIMKNLTNEFDTAILLITHDLGVVSEIADKVVVMYAGQVFENASVDRIFDKPLHPYTQGLLDSIPKIEGKIERLSSIKGNVPLPSEMPKGCRFAPRCPKAFDRCLEANPELTDYEPGHRVRCFLYDERGVEE